MKILFLYIISIFVVISLNLLSRLTGINSKKRELPPQYLIQSKILLKIYVISPKNKITKYAYGLYLSQVVINFILLILLILNLYICFSDVVINIISIIYSINVILVVVLCYSIDKINDYLYSKF